MKGIVQRRRLQERGKGEEYRTGKQLVTHRKLREKEKLRMGSPADQRKGEEEIVEVLNCRDWRKKREFEGEPKGKTERGKISGRFGWITVKSEILGFVSGRIDMDLSCGAFKILPRVYNFDFGFNSGFYHSF